MQRSQFSKSYEHAPQAESVPLAFGANFHDDPLMRPNLRKSHNLSTAACGAKLPSLYAPHTEYNLTGCPVGMDRSVAAQDDADALRRLNEYRHPELHFLAYVSEPVFESPEELERVRKLRLTFFTEDNTIALAEAKQVNSGMSQGPYLNRQKVPKDGASGPLLLEKDLSIGATVKIYGKPVHIVGMAAATRSYFQAKGVYVPSEDLPWPGEDVYNATMQSKMSKSARRQIPTDDMDNKRALESLVSGGLITKHHPEDVRCAKQFFDNKINECLQFAAVWDNRRRISGDLHHVVLKYYLENDTVEVIERRRENHGCDGGPKMLVRQRVPRANVDVSKCRTQQSTYGVTLRSDFMTAEDFAVGCVVTIHGHDYLIYDADEFTRRFYTNKYNLDLAPPVDISEIEQLGARKDVKHFPPPHNGFGSEEDSLQNCKSLVLRPPRIDAEKQWREKDKSMIFAAELATRDPVDASRKFVITFHRATDEVEIGEKAVRNSGIIAGKFLQKGRHQKELPNGKKVYFQPSDFVEGGTVHIAGRTFRLLDMDERSRRIVAGLEDDVTEERVKELVLLFRTLVATKYLRVQEAFRAISPSGTMTVADVVDFFRRSSCRVRVEEAAHVVQYVAPKSPGIVTYDDFLNFIDGSEGTSSMDAASNNTKSIKNVNMELKPEFSTSTVAANEDAQRRRLKTLLLNKLSERRGTVQEVFRLMAGHAFNSRLSRSEFSSGLRDVLHINVNPTDRALLLSIVFDGREGADASISYKQFCEMIESA